MDTHVGLNVAHVSAMSTQTYVGLLCCVGSGSNVALPLHGLALHVNVWQQQITLPAVVYEVMRLSFNWVNYTIIDFIGSVCVGQCQ